MRRLKKQVPKEFRVPDVMVVHMALQPGAGLGAVQAPPADMGTSSSGDTPLAG